MGVLVGLPKFVFFGFFGFLEAFLVSVVVQIWFFWFSRRFFGSEAVGSQLACKNFGLWNECIGIPLIYSSMSGQGMHK